MCGHPTLWVDKPPSLFHARIGIAQPAPEFQLNNWLDSIRSYLGRFFGIPELPLLHRILVQPLCPVDWHSLRPPPCTLCFVSHTIGRPDRGIATLSFMHTTSDDPLICLRILFVYRRWVFAVWRHRRSVLRMLCETTVCRRSVLRVRVREATVWRRSVRGSL